MRVSFWRSVASEWLKGRRSLAAWLVTLGGLFVPAVILLLRLRQAGGLATLYAGEVFWEELWNQAWESLAVLFLPLELIVLTSLVTQLEYRYHAWKQVRATPQSDAAIVGAKLVVVLVRTAQLLALIVLGVWLAGVLPPLLLRHVPFPREPFPLAAFARRAGEFLVDALPLVGAQFLLGLHSRNVLLPIGVGIAGWTVAMVALSWRFNWLLPHGYLAMDFLAETGGGRVARALPMALPVLAALLAAAFVLAAHLLFVWRREPA